MRLDQDNSPKVADERLAQTQVKKHREHIGTIIPHNGHTVWEYDSQTGEITAAEFAKTTLEFPTSKNAKVGVNKRINVREGCMYVPALNKKNALKKITAQHHKVVKMYAANYDVVNDYLAYQISKWLDFAEKNPTDQAAQTELLEQLNQQWYEWLYRKNETLYNYYYHLFYERWNMTMDMLIKNKAQGNG